MQEGRKVFREVVPMVSDMIVDHANDLALDPHGLKRLWLHQANINMNEMIGRKVLGRDPTPEENVIILDDTPTPPPPARSSPSTRANDDFAPGDTGPDLLVRRRLFGRHGVRPEAVGLSPGPYPRPQAIRHPHPRMEAAVVDAVLQPTGSLDRRSRHCHAHRAIRIAFFG